MFEIGPLSAEVERSFAMETTGCFLPGLAISRTSSSASTFRRSRALVARSGIESILVQVYLSGDYMLDVEGTRSVVRSGDVAVVDLRRESLIEAGPYSNVALTLQSALLSPLIVEMDGLHGLVLKRGEPRNALLRSHMEMLHAEAPSFALSEQSAVSQGTAALVAACLGPSLATRGGAPSDDPVTLLQSIRRGIEARLPDGNLSPDLIAKRFGVSRASLYRLFEPFGGVRSYIQQRRLIRAYQLITNPSRFDEPLDAIARQVGYDHPTTFSRAFRALYRMRPKDVRAAARSGFAPNLPAAQGEPFGRLNRWLLGLDANAI